MSTKDAASAAANVMAQVQVAVKLRQGAENSGASLSKEECQLVIDMMRVLAAGAKQP